MEPKESDRFRAGLSSTSSEFAEEILSPHFGDLIQFVKEAERSIQTGQAKKVQDEEGKS